jgi:hypothetical protein
LAVHSKLEVIVTDCVSWFTENSEIEDKDKFSDSSTSESLELQLYKKVKTKNAKRKCNTLIISFYKFNIDKILTSKKEILNL